MNYLVLFSMLFAMCRTSEKSESSAPQVTQLCVGLDQEKCKEQAFQCFYNTAQNKCDLKPYLACEKLTVEKCASGSGCAVDPVSKRCGFPKNCADMEIDECGRNLRKCQFDQTNSKCFDPIQVANVACEQRSQITCIADGKCAIHPQTKLCVGISGAVLGTSPLTYPSVCTQPAINQLTCQQNNNCCAWTGSTCAERFTYSINGSSTSAVSCEAAPDINTCLRGQGYLNSCSWSRVFNKCVPGNLCRVDINVCRCLPHCDMSEVGTCMVR